MDSDAVVWTVDGRRQLADEHNAGSPLCDGESTPHLRERIEISLARFRPCWERGFAKSDEVGRTLIAHVMHAWANGATPFSLSVDHAAGIASLLGARSGDHDAPLFELFVRRHGLAFVVRVLVRMWSLATGYDDPDWPRKEHRLAIYLREVNDDMTSHLNDSSVSHGKARIADNLGKRYRIGTAFDRAEIETAVAAEWHTAPLWTRPALAVAAQSTLLAEQVATEIVDGTYPWYPHYARKYLPILIRDLRLLDRLGFLKDGTITMRFLEQHGTALLPVLAARCAANPSEHDRRRLAAVLANIQGPTAARLLAELATPTADASVPRKGPSSRPPMLRTESRSRRR